MQCGHYATGAMNVCFPLVTVFASTHTGTRMQEEWFVPDYINCSYSVSDEEAIPDRFIILVVLSRDGYWR